MAEKLGEFYYVVSADGKVAVNEMNNVERQMVSISNRTASKVKNAFSRMFGIGALIGMGIAAVRSFYHAIADGVGRAIESNKALKTAVDKMKDGFKDLFTNIGFMLAPLIQAVTGVVEKLLDASRKMFANSMLESLYNQSKTDMQGVKDIIKTASTDSLKAWNERATKNLKEENELISRRIAIMREQGYTQAEINKAVEGEKDYVATVLEIQRLINAALASRKGATVSGGTTNTEETVANLLKLVKGLNNELAASVMPFGNFGSNLSKINGLIDQYDEIQKSGADATTKASASMADQAMIAVAIAQAISDLVVELSSWVDKLHLLSSESYATELRMNALISQIEQYSSLMEDLNYQIDVQNRLLGIEKNIKNDSEEDIQREIDQTNVTIDQQKDLLRIAEEKVKAVEKEFGISRENFGAKKAQLQKEKADNDEIIRQRKQWEDGLRAIPIIGEGLAAAYHAIMIDPLEDANAAIQNQINALDAGITARGEVESILKIIDDLGFDINDLEQEKLDLINEQLEKQKQITEELRNQTEEIIRQQAKLGILDLENVGDIRRVLAQLRASGLAGLDLASAALDLGITGRSLGRVTHIGTVQMNNYSASNNNVNLNGVLNTQTGA